VAFFGRTLGADSPMSKKSNISRADSRTPLLIACIEDLETIKPTTTQPAKVLKFELARKYPSLRQREIEAAFSVVFNRRPGRPKK
jgi:hypothetical protein